MGILRVLLVLVACCVAVAQASTTTVERWNVAQIDMTGPSASSTTNPFVDVTLTATFTLQNSSFSEAEAGACGGCTGRRVCGGEAGGPKSCQMPRVVTVTGFYDGANTHNILYGAYKIRFAPPFEGVWEYVTGSNAKALQGLRGAVTATKPGVGNHGAVSTNKFAFQFEDGTPYFSAGSTSYQWSSMPLEMQEQTLQTLREGQGEGQVFNKQRMTVFPKWYQHNKQNPVQVGTAYDIIPGSVAANETAWNCVGGHCPSTAGSFDFTRFNVSYWQNYERLIGEMQAMGVVADIIVFHPYDNGHWGFDCMGGRNGSHYDTAHDNFYLQYLSARLSAFSNVWWSMANEWNFCQCKSVASDPQFCPAQHRCPTPVWDELFHTLTKADPYGRQTSIHNGALLYNHSQPWISHVSLQGHEDDTPALRTRYGKPMVWDEERYEGNITASWGALTGEEMADRFWWGASMGVHVGHSETIMRDGFSDDLQPLWWAKGGALIGESPSRIKWFRELWEARRVFGALVPTQAYLGDESHSAFAANVLTAEDGGYQFLHFTRAGRWEVPLSYNASAQTPPPQAWEVRSLDYWNMQIKVVTTLPITATSVVIDVATLPANYEIITLP